MSLLSRDDGNGIIQAFPLPDDTAANHIALTIGVASAATASLAKGVYRLSTDIDCQVVLAGTATTSHMPLSATQSEYFEVEGVVAAITTAPGTLTLTRV